MIAQRGKIVPRACDQMSRQMAKASPLGAKVAAVTGVGESAQVDEKRSGAQVATLKIPQGQGSRAGPGLAQGCAVAGKRDRSLEAGGGKLQPRHSAIGDRPDWGRTPKPGILRRTRIELPWVGYPSSMPHPVRLAAGSEPASSLQNPTQLASDPM